MKKSVITDDHNNGINKTNNPIIKARVKELEKSLKINTSFKNIPGYFILGGGLCVISNIKPIIIVGLILAGIALILSFSNNYKNVYRWNKAITLYFTNDIEKAKILLDKLSSTEKEGEAYKKMLELLNNESVPL